MRHFWFLRSYYGSPTIHINHLVHKVYEGFLVSHNQKIEERTADWTASIRHDLWTSEVCFGWNWGWGEVMDFDIWVWHIEHKPDWPIAAPPQGPQLHALSPTLLDQIWWSFRGWCIFTWMYRIHKMMLIAPSWSYQRAKKVPNLQAAMSNTLQITHTELWKMSWSLLTC